MISIFDCINPLYAKVKTAKAGSKKNSNKKTMSAPKIEVYNTGEKTVQILIHYSDTDEFIKFLEYRGRNVLSVFYGAFNESDLVTYEI